MKQLGNSIAVDAVEMVGKNVVRYMPFLDRQKPAIQTTQNRGEWEAGKRTLVAAASEKEGLESLFEPLFFNTENLSTRQQKAAYQSFLDGYFATQKHGDHQLASFLEARVKTLS